jgi:hypothetical protein
MRRALLLYALVMLACVLPTPSARAQPGDFVNLSADRVTYEGDQVRAEGNVTLELEGGRLFCQRLEYDRTTGQVQAWGECVLYRQDSYLTAERLTYSTVTRRAVLTRVAGLGRDLVLTDRPVRAEIFFWAQSATWTPEKITLQDVTLTTCDSPPHDWHYHFTARTVDIYPEEQMVISDASLFLHDRHLYTLPTLLFSLRRDPADRRRQPLLPQPGYNKLDGFFVRNDLNYELGPRDYGTVHLDYYSRTGLAGGIDHFYSLGRRGSGVLHYYQQRPSAAGGDPSLTRQGRFEVSNSLAYNLGPGTTLALNYTASRFELPGFTSPLTIGSYLSLAHSTTDYYVNLAGAYASAGPASTLLGRLYYSHLLGEEWSTRWSADLSESRFGSFRTRRGRLAGSLFYRGRWLEGELNLQNNSSGDLFFVNRLPELNLRTRPLALGPVPLVAWTGLARLEESPTMVATSRVEAGLQVPDQSLEYGSGRLTAGAGILQRFYGTGQAVTGPWARASWLQHLGRDVQVRLDYNLSHPSGPGPFVFDELFSDHSLYGTVQVGDAVRWRLSVLGHYDLDARRFRGVMPRLELRPGGSLQMVTASTYDPDSRRWRTLDTQLTLRLSPGLSLQHWQVYDFTRSALTYQDYLVRWEEHDWTTSLVYRGVQNEFFLQFSLKAFPEPQVSIGPNERDVILPLNLGNPFRR